MTDPVNVPREVLEKAVAVIQHLDPSLQDVGEASFRTLVGSLSAAPKSEPVSDPYKLVREAINGLIEWDKKTGFRVPYRVRDPLHSALALIQPLSNPQQLPEAPKVEQEPHWLERYDDGGGVDLLGYDVNFEDQAEWDVVHLRFTAGDGSVTTRSYTHPAPASDELLEALEGIEADAGRYAAMYPHGSDGRNTFLIFADAIARRIAKHKGPQS